MQIPLYSSLAEVDVNETFLFPSFSTVLVLFRTSAPRTSAADLYAWASVIHVTSNGSCSLTAYGLDLEKLNCNSLFSTKKNSYANLVFQICSYFHGLLQAASNPVAKLGFLYGMLKLRDFLCPKISQNFPKQKQEFIEGCKSDQA